MTDDVRRIRALARSAREAGDALRGATVEDRIAWLVTAAELLVEAVSESQERLASETGLSVPMVEWGARTTLETVHAEALRAVAEDARRSGGEPLAMLAVVLAGNLFTVPIRAVFVPLLLGVPVLAKAASRETSFASMVEQALEQADSTLGRAMRLVVFRGGEPELESALVESAEAVAVYGTDETVRAIEARHPELPAIVHGHGVSAAYCGREALTEKHIGRTVSGLALDICAYDQRGCLSPQIVYADASSSADILAFSERLAKDGLGPTGARLPRGPLPAEVGAAQAQWRGICEVEGALIVGDTFSVAVRSAEMPIRWSPAFRNVSVTRVSGLDEAVHVMEGLGGSLKCVGADPASLGELEGRLQRSSSLSAYACPLGSMQTPAFDAPADGKPVWHGLVR